MNPGNLCYLMKPNLLALDPEMDGEVTFAIMKETLTADGMTMKVVTTRDGL